MKTRLNLRDAVEDLAPPAPPCWHNQHEWVEYLKSAAAAQNQRDEPTVIYLGVMGEPHFNFQFPFCTDCSSAHRQSMQIAQRCQPDHLYSLCNTTTNSKAPSKPSEPSSNRSAPPQPDRSKPIQPSLLLVDHQKPRPADLSSVFTRWAR